MSGSSPAKGKPGRKPHPLLADRDRTVWHEDAVGVVPRYPKTALAFARRHHRPPPDAAAQMNDAARPMSERLALARLLAEAERRKR